MKGTFANFASVVGGEVAVRAVNFLAAVVIARQYGASELGTFATCLAMATVAVMIADNGFQLSTVAEASRRPGQIDFILWQLYAAKTLLFAAMLALLTVAGLLMHYPSTVWVIGGFITLRTMAYSYCQVNAGILKSIDRMKVIGATQFVHALVLMSGVATVYFLGLRIEYLLGIMLGCQFTELMASSLYIRVSCGIRPQRSTLSSCFKIMRHSAPIGITYSLANLILRCDVLILSLFVSPIAVGHFAAANMALVMVYVASWLFTSVTLPKMVQLAENADQLKAYVHRCVQYILVTTVPLCVLAFLIAQPVMRFLYGAGYSETGTLSSIMVLSVPFILLNSLYLAHAVALKAVQVYCSMYVGTAVLTLLLNGALGYLYGGQGIAVAIVIREVLMASVFTLVSRPVSLSTAAGTLGYADVDPREV